VRSRGDARFGRARGGAEGGERARVARKAPRRPSLRDRALPRTVSRLSARLRRARPRSAPGHRSSAWPRSWQRGAHRGVGRAREERVDAPSCSCVRCVVDSRRPLDAGAPFTRTSSTARACARAGVRATSGGWRSTASTRLSRRLNAPPRKRREDDDCQPLFSGGRFSDHSQREGSREQTQSQQCHPRVRDRARRRKDSHQLDAAWPTGFRVE
jgi:hypothetical protein